jgi:hypothetical protein
LGERLFNGLTSKLGSLTDFLKRLNDQILAVQDRAAQAALDAADAFYAGSQQRAEDTAGSAPPVEIHNVYNFNVPVESPNDTQRRIEQANEDLAAALAYR